MLIELKLNEFTAIADTFGGELISYKDESGLEYLWNGDEKYWVGRSPHLFPIIGALKDNRTIIGGQKFSINKHGFARNSDFLVAEKGSNFILFLLRSNDDTRKFYPYEFELYIKHELIEYGFKTSYCIKNIDDKPISFCIGGHVGFKVPLNNDESFDEYSILFDKRITNEAMIPPNDEAFSKEESIPYINNTNVLPLNYEIFDRGAIILDKIQSNSVVLKHNKRNHGVRFCFEGFPVLALWTFPKKRAPFICLEPWHGLPAMTDDSKYFEEKPYMITIDQNKQCNLGYTVNIIKVNRII